MILGILASLLGALGQAYNYAITKDCQVKYHLVGFRLLDGSLIFMALLLLFPCTVLGYFSYFDPKEDFGYLIRTNVPFLFGQYFMLCALRYSDASVVSPLLALKVPAMCLITFIFMGEVLTNLCGIVSYLLCAL